jgi:hypothetical protein
MLVPGRKKMVVCGKEDRQSPANRDRSISACAKLAGLEAANCRDQEDLQRSRKSCVPGSGHTASL